jgi:NAD(P)-dependent dehydrogenase (short-subunit alcohol dehydrogenase family)
LNPHYVVVGGTKGSGLALVEYLVRRKRTVSVVGRSKPRHFPSGADFFGCDITVKSATHRQLRRCVQANGPVNYLVFCQRYRGHGDPWRGELATSLTATRWIVDQLLPAFATGGDRALAFIASIATDFVVLSQGDAYHVAKAALVQLMRYYAVTLGGRGIRSNSISPGTVLKPEAAAYYAAREELRRAKEALSPLGRMGRPLDVAYAVDFLCSPRAAFITGHNLIVDGGMTLLGHEELAAPKSPSTSGGVQ